MMLKATAKLRIKNATHKHLASFFVLESNFYGFLALTLDEDAI